MPIGVYTRTDAMKTGRVKTGRGVVPIATSVKLFMSFPTVGLLFTYSNGTMVVMYPGNDRLPAKERHLILVARLKGELTAEQAREFLG
jgi:hypothetical protein